MGLDVYLYHCPDLALAKREEEAAEAAKEALYKEISDIPGNTEEVDATSFGPLPRRKERRLTEAARGLYKARSAEVDLKHGIKGFTHESNVKIELPSPQHPEHLFKIGYWRSSYNEGGINNVLGGQGLPTLYDIVERERDDESAYEFQPPSWQVALDNAKAARARLGALSDAGILRASAVGHNPFSKPPKDVSTEEAALKLYTQVAERYPPGAKDDRSFGCQEGEFWLGGFEIVAALPGFTSLGAPAVWLVHKMTANAMKWYVEALGIVVETLEYVLAQPDPENFTLHWSS